MKSEHTEHALTQLYRNAARERSPLWLDAKILEAAARHARIRKTVRRIRLLAVAAVVAGLAIAIPQWTASHRDQAITTSVTSIDPHSPLADALRSLRVLQVTPSIVASCLQRSDLCSADPKNQN